MVFILYGVLALWLFTNEAVGLECHTCNNATNIRDCTAIATCALDEICYTRQLGVGTNLTFDLGCTVELECPQASSIGSLGRSVRKHSMCSKCCKADRCNINMCTAGIPVDGSWSTWSTLSKCDVACGSGHMTRTRTCTDPAPAHGGLDCVGNSTEIQTCVQQPCPSCKEFINLQVDGIWTDWGVWSTCSETCGAGLKTRQRSCSNPKPSVDGTPCGGLPIEYKPCILHGCNDQSVAFSVTSPSRAMANSHPVFTNVLTNIGASYNLNTGQFTCRIPGIYSFSARLLALAPKQAVFCYICKNGTTIISVRGYWSESPVSGSVQTFLQLTVGDTIDMCYCTNWTNVNTGTGTSFNGALISPA